MAATDERVSALERIIAWRPLSDADLANAGMDAPVASNDAEIFPRNATHRLFKYYLGAGDETEVAHFADVILEQMDGSACYCLWYGRDFKTIVARLRRAGCLPRARALLERYLVDVGVLRPADVSFEIGDALPQIDRILAGYAAMNSERHDETH